MARIWLPLRDRDRSRQERRVGERPLTGSTLFPDLVWAHYRWQLRSRPYVFPRQPRWARRMLAVTARMNGRPSPVSANGAGPSPDEVDRLRTAYERAAATFEREEGRILRAYWCATEASAVVLTEKRTWLSRLVPRRVGDLRLHRVTDWVTADAPKVAELLHGGDMLAVRINSVLTAVPKRIAMEWIFSEQSYLLGLVERSGGHPSRRQTRNAVDRHREEIDRLERYYDRAARKAARIWYFAGMLAGLAAVGGLGALTPLIIGAFADLRLTDDALRAFYACFGAGALGAMVSVMTRMRDEKGVVLDYEVGELLIVLLGAFRPVLGAVFGVLTYFAIASEVLPLAPPPGREFVYYAVFAFAAGFSERFAHVIRGQAELTAAKALGGDETAEPAPPQAGAPAPAEQSGSRNGQVVEKPAAEAPPAGAAAR